MYDSFEVYLTSALDRIASSFYVFDAKCVFLISFSTFSLQLKGHLYLRSPLSILLIQARIMRRMLFAFI